MDKKDIGKRIKLRRTALDMTQGNIADQIGVAISTVQRYEAGTIDRMKIPILEAIARVIKVSPDWLVGKSDKMELSDKNFASSLDANQSTRIKVYSSIPDGVQITEIEDIIDYEYIPIEWVREGNEYIGLKVNDNSMYPKYIKGDTLIVKLQPDCENAQDAIVCIIGYGVVLKKVVKLENGIILQPLNPEYIPKQYIFDKETDSGVKVLGVVVEIRRKV